MGLQRHVGLRWVSKGTSVSDGSQKARRSPMGLKRHVGLRWVSGQACRSPKGHVKVSDGAPIIVIFS